jgi:cation diffusion facilitator family transporter
MEDRMGNTVHRDRLERWGHSHVFGQDRRRSGESRTWLVILLTAVTMVLEIGAGIAFGSMALLADGLHMGSHTVALGISAFAYAYARRHARDPRFSFGTGKVNALGGFTGALLLAAFALGMAWESIGRLLSPRPIAFDWALAVAVLGLLVNALSVLILGAGHPPGHGTETPHTHDHNLRSAYLHVLADALTSVLAIVALLAGKFAGLNWVDPLVGILGALLVAHWSLGLLRQSAEVLLDHQAPQALLEQVRQSIEAHGADRVADLHLWCVGPGLHAAEIVVLTHDDITPDAVKARLPAELQLVHSTVEIHRCCQ